MLSVAAGAIGRFSRAGVTWTCRTSSAPWAARRDHTSVIDAAGAIYVLGGDDRGGTYYKDVYVSTDGGAPPGLSWGVVGAYFGSTTGVLERVLEGVCEGVLQGYSRGTSRVPRVDTRGNREGTKGY